MATAIKERFLKFDAVAELIGLSRTTIWRMEQNNAFPKRIKLGTSRVAWRESQISEWMESRS